MGYPRVVLTSTAQNKTKNYLVHRLVAYAFLPSPPTPQHVTVDHIDGNPGNPTASNLRWATMPEQAKNKRAPVYSAKHAIQQIDLSTGEVLRTYATATEAEQAVPNGQHQNIIHCATGRYQSHAGYIWRYVVPREFIESSVERRSVPTWFTQGATIYATADGRLCNTHGKRLVGQADEDDRVAHQLHIGNRKYIRRQASHLVIAAWRPLEFTPTVYDAILRNELVVHHVDHDCSNNALQNLQIVTRSENTRLWHEYKKQRI